MAAKLLPRLRGIMAPLTTPYGSDYKIAHDKLIGNIEKMIAQTHSADGTVPAFVALGTNSETPLLTRQERLGLVKYVKTWLDEFRQKNNSEQPLIVGTGAESTLETIDNCRAFKEAGADVALVLTPSYYKSAMTHKALLDYYTAIADNSPIPILIYNMPANTGVDLSPEAIAFLAAHDNIVGMKESGGDITKIQRVVHETRNNEFVTLAGSAGFLLPALQAGATGAICAFANCCSGPLVSMYNQFTANGWTQNLQNAQNNIILANTLVTRRHGVPGLKHAMELCGYFGGSVRPPLQKLDVEQQQEIEHAFMRAQLI